MSMKIFFHGCLELSKRTATCYLRRLFQMFVALNVKVRWPDAVVKRGYLKRIALASKAILYI